MSRLRGAVVGEFLVGEENVGDLAFEGDAPELQLIAERWRHLAAFNFIAMNPPVLLLLGERPQYEGRTAATILSAPSIVLSSEAIKLRVDHVGIAHPAVMLLVGELPWIGVPGLVPSAPYEEDLLVPTARTLELALSAAVVVDEPELLVPTGERFL